MTTSPTGFDPLAIINQPLTIGPLVLPHRLVMGSMHLGLEGHRQFLDRLGTFYGERIRGGAALITLGGVAVTQEGGGQDMLGFYDSDHVAMLAELVERIHRCHGLVGVQLFHAGRYAKEAETGLKPLAPSSVYCSMTRNTPQSMTVEDIERTLDAFVHAARQAYDAGFDAIEIMGSEGYLLNEFLAPFTNRRDDAFGGDEIRRQRFPLAVAQGIVDAVGDKIAVIYRISGEDFIEDGTPSTATIRFAKALQDSGVHALNVGVGWHESSVPTVAAIVPQGAFQAVYWALRHAVTIPIMGANRLNTREIIHHVLNNGSVDVISAARPWLADPQFGNKVRGLVPHRLNVCVACNQACLDHVLAKNPKPVSCLVNPRCSHENRPIHKVSRVKRIAVVGSGPAGLEVSRRARELGHEVVLFEQHDEIGGQLALAAKIPGKQDFHYTLDYYQAELDRLGVLIRTSTTPDEATLLNFDVVVQATGSQPQWPSFAPITDERVVSFIDILKGKRPLSRHVVIVGSGGVGIDVAIFTAHHHHGPITLLSRSGILGRSLGPSTRWIWIRELRALGVHVVGPFQSLAVTDKGIRYEEPLGKFHDVDADQIILCAGSIPNPWPYSLPSHILTLSIGAANNPATIDAKHSFRQGYWAAQLLGQVKEGP
ncbi:FAD-dependent oxidoreductase [Sulfobacillus thermosulfidooxidans]|uniref:oxidoreductase n=1 Tax=Sulfobacillus thermosulfidooxidans TaxID=28034 RepID=UPI0006B4A9C9|nr:FAD-dependent oxidoreductase [Sulfobacillus thermosulfidooxidans]